MLGIAQRDFKEDGFSGKRHSLKAPKQPSPQLACQEFHRGANSGSTWGWLLLEGVKKPDIIFGVGQMPAAWHIPFFDQLPQYDYVISTETFLPIKLPTQTTVLAFFLLLGCVQASRPLTSFYLQIEKKPILKLPLFLHETRLDCWSHLILYLIYYLLGLNCPIGFFTIF